MIPQMITAAAIALKLSQGVKSRGSRAKAITDSKSLDDRFRVLNANNKGLSSVLGFGFYDFCGFLARQLMNNFILNGNFEDFQSIPVRPDKLEITDLFMIGEKKDGYALKYKNLAGYEKLYQFLLTRVCDVDTDVFFNVDSIEYYREANIQANEVLNEHIFNYKKEPNKRTANRVFETLIRGYFMSGSPSQLVIPMLHTDEQNTNAVVRLLQEDKFLKDLYQYIFNVMIHEFYHAIEPEKEEEVAELKQSTGRSYYASKRQRATIGNDIVMSLLLQYPDLSNAEQHELKRAIQKRNFGTMCIYEKNLFAAFMSDNKDAEQAYLLMFHKMGGLGEYNDEEFDKLSSSLSDQEFIELQNDILRNEYNVYLKNKYKERKSFYSLHKWFDMVERAFKDRGLL